ncbi:MAG: cysteine dioxygenase family protein [Woeseia sp.]|nr:cysteine dioxygenase family protein [Woeseia sp.]MBT8095971.1 cysteine dioxygenase family protein [Woeseia sp.]NNE60015.1 cysteine dioxygenase family protein [Woeseia sp.]NNL55590.1 cysteine dioxygenase family protein [Woeseia sp.]
MTTPGTAELIRLVDDAVSRDSVSETVEAIKGSLCKLIRSSQIELPAEFTEPVDGHYARRLLHINDDLGYSIVVMTWGPGQKTPIHDHSGMWCVEGVWGGSIDVQQYELTEEKAGHFRFEPRNSYEAGVGSAGCLIPPYEYHSISNACGDRPAVSLHIYGGEMKCCSVFVKQPNGSFKRAERQLGYDN